MKESTNNLMDRYLLGDLPEAEQTAMEERCFADRDVFEEMWARENQLVDDYVRGRLRGQQRQRFETYYLSSPVHQRRVLAARYLLAAADGKVFEAEPSLIQRFVQSLSTWGAPQMALTAAVILLAAGSIWLLIERSRLQEELAVARIENAIRSSPTPIVEREKPSPVLPATPETTTAPPQQQRVLAFSLSPLSVRSGEGNSIAISGDVDIVRLKLVRPAGEWANFRASIQRVGGPVGGPAAWSSRDLRAREGGITLDVPSTKLPADDYILTLTGVTAGRSEEAERYSFRIVRK